MRKVVTLPDYLPDQLPTGSILTKAENVFPAQGGVTPARALSVSSDALDGPFMGGSAFIAQDGTVYLIAGTATTLEKLNAGSWTDLLSGLTISGRWCFAQFGNYALGVNGTAGYQIDLATGTASVVAGMPSGNGIAIVGEHVLVSQPNGDSLKIAASARFDHTGWTPGIDGSIEETLNDGGEVMGVVGGEYGVILQRNKLVRANLTGDADAPFNFDAITNNYGCASSASICQAGRSVFFLSDRGFVALEDGQVVKPLGTEKFDKAFQQDVPRSEYEKIYAVVDPQRTVVMWALPGTPGKVWVYNWVLDRVTTLSLPLTGMFTAYTTNLTLEQVSALYPDLDAMPYSLDDARFEGGAPKVYFVDADNQIGTLTGATLAASLRQGHYAPFGELVSRFRGLWLLSDATDNVTGYFEVRQRLGDEAVTTIESDMQASGRIPMRARGRFVKAGVDIAAGADWSYLNGYEIEADPGGVR